jgi:hypothetical protein
MDLETKNAMVASLCETCAGDTCTARLISNLVPDTATFDALCVSTLLVGSEPHMSTKIDNIVEQLGMTVKKSPLMLREWAAVLWEVQFILRRHEQCPPWEIQRVKFDDELQRVHTDSVLTVTVLRTIRAQKA